MCPTAPAAPCVDVPPGGAADATENPRKLLDGACVRGGGGGAEMKRPPPLGCFAGREFYLSFVEVKVS